MDLQTLNNVDWVGFKPRNIADAYKKAEVELQEDDELDEVFSEWQDHVNMSASELRRWSKNPCSREASVEPVNVIRRNLRLLEKNKDEWTDEDVKDAKRTISFISRMKPNKPDNPRDGPHGCPSEWAISLLNWAFNPFDSLPETPDDEDLEPVEEVTLDEEELRIGPDSGKRSPNYEFEPVPDQVVYSERELAEQRAVNMGMDRGAHEHVLVFDGEEVTMYMPGETHRDWAEHVNHPRQLDEEEQSEDEEQSENSEDEVSEVDGTTFDANVEEAEQVFSSHQARSESSSEDEDGVVRVEPTTIYELTDTEDGDEEKEEE